MRSACASGRTSVLRASEQSLKCPPDFFEPRKTLVSLLRLSSGDAMPLSPMLVGLASGEPDNSNFTLGVTLEEWAAPLGLHHQRRPGLLGVTLRAQPRNTAFSVHPLVNFDLALEPFDLNGLRTGKLGQDVPVALGDTNGFKAYLGFCRSGCMPTI